MTAAPDDDKDYGLPPKWSAPAAAHPLADMNMGLFARRASEADRAFMELVTLTEELGLYEQEDKT